MGRYAPAREMCDGHQNSETPGVKRQNRCATGLNKPSQIFVVSLIFGMR